MSLYHQHGSNLHSAHDTDTLIYRHNPHRHRFEAVSVYGVHELTLLCCCCMGRVHVIAAHRRLQTRTEHATQVLSLSHTNMDRNPRCLLHADHACVTCAMMSLCCYGVRSVHLVARSLPSHYVRTHSFDMNRNDLYPLCICDRYATSGIVLCSVYLVALIVTQARPIAYTHKHT